MRGYELCLIFQHETTEESIDQKVGSLQEKAVSIGGEIIKIEKWGKRSLKYAIKKQQKGYYCFVSLTGDNKTLHEIERMFKYDESVLRYSYIRLEESEVKAITEIPEPVKAAETKPAETKAVEEEKTTEAETTPEKTENEPAAKEIAESAEASDIEI